MANDFNYSCVFDAYAVIEGGGIVIENDYYLFELHDGTLLKIHYSEVDIDGEFPFLLKHGDVYYNLHTTKIDDVKDTQEYKYSSEDPAADVKIEELLAKTEQKTEFSKWDDKNTKLLINLYQEKVPKLGKTFDLKNKKKMWVKIAQLMADHNYNFSPKQIANKWKVLERGFKKKITLNKQTGSNRVSCMFERELTEVLVDKDSVIPEFTLDAKGEGQSKMDMIKSTLTASDTDDDLLPSIENENLKKKKRTVSDYLKKLIEIQEKYTKEKLSAYERRTDEIRKCNELLKQLIDKN